MLVLWEWYFPMLSKSATACTLQTVRGLHICRMSSAVPDILAQGPEDISWSLTRLLPSRLNDTRHLKKWLRAKVRELCKA
jgi:hypothetical protein